MIYLKMRGRIGNQLFMYATARAIQEIKGNNEEIIIEDYENESSDGIIYDNSLTNYKLNNVTFVNDLSSFYKLKKRTYLTVLFFNRIIERYLSNDSKRRIEVACQPLFNSLGIFKMQDGFVKYPKKFKEDTYIEGYFQSERFFEGIKEEIKNTFRIEEVLENSDYPNLELIKKRNTVCISIKVQHNVGNEMYDICHDDYYSKAIDYIIKHVDNPLFFICSDNVEYVKQHLIDTEKYDTVCQATNQPVHISLAAMAQCKHYIIGNTSFGWWAQYLSKNDEKIVIVPDRWYNNQGDWQYDIYMKDWIRIDA